MLLQDAYYPTYAGPQPSDPTNNPNTNRRAAPAGFDQGPSGQSDSPRYGRYSGILDDSDASYSRSSSRSRQGRRRRRSRSSSRSSRSRSGIRDAIKEHFDPNAVGLFPGAVGAMAGGLLGNEVGHGKLAALAGAVIGGVGGTAWGKRRNKK